MTAIDFAGVSQRQESVRFEILDSFNQPIGKDLGPVRDTPTITVDIDRSIIRTMDNLIIPASDTSGIDVLAHRLKPYWVIEGEAEYPLGVFLFADASNVIHSYGDSVECNLVDQSLILEQDLSETVSYDGENITVALREQADIAGIVSNNIENTSSSVPVPTAWAAGRDTRLKVMKDLCELAGFLSPYFDNEGTLICRSAPDPVMSPPDFEYGPAAINTVIADSIYQSDDLLEAPNRYLVIDTGSNENEITGVFDVPPDLPFSAAQRGFVVQRTIDTQGLANDAAAENAAVAAYLQDAGTFRWLSFATTPNPRHDVFNLVSFESVTYREVGWSLPLSAGAQMEHDMRGNAE